MHGDLADRDRRGPLHDRRYLGERPPSLLARRLAQWQVRCAQVPAKVASGSFVRRAHALGLDVHVWTINDRAEMSRLLDLGADGIMTDDIETLREVLIERGQWHPRGP